MRLAYADPPYPGQSAKHYANHPDYAGEVDHRKLLKQLDNEYDGWVLHTSSTKLTEVMGAEPDDDLHDLYPGTGAVGDAWMVWRREVRLFDNAESAQ